MPSDLDTLLKRLHIKSFRNPDLLALSLVHRSYLNEAEPPGQASNERLEFLGDAILGSVVADYLYHRYPTVPEGRLTELRSHIVKAETLARVGERLDLGAHLLLGRGEEATGGRERPLNLARAFEAVLGAIYLDKGYKLTEKWLLKTLAPEFEGLGVGEVPADAKSQMQHLGQKLFGVTPRYRILDVSGPDHDRVYQIEVYAGEKALGRGSGKSKRAAEREAAANALLSLAEQHPDALTA